MLALRGGGGTRQRTHDHYLKGSLWCGRCSRRLILTPGRGNGGTYFYFLCRGRQQGVCTLPYLPVDIVGRAIERHYAGVRLSENFRARVRTQLDDALKEELADLSTARQRLRDRLNQLDVQEDRYIELLGDPDWPQAKLKQNSPSSGGTGRTSSGSSETPRAASTLAASSSCWRSIC